MTNVLEKVVVYHKNLKQHLQHLYNYLHICQNPDDLTLCHSKKFLPKMIEEHDIKNSITIIMLCEHLGDELINEAIQSMPLIQTEAFT